MRRVLVTGLGVASPIGGSLEEVTAALQSGRSGVRTQHDWDDREGLDTRLAAPVSGVSLKGYPRKKVRSMGGVSLLALYATEQALSSAGLEGDQVSCPEVGLAYGSTHGSSAALLDFVRPFLSSGGFLGIAPQTYLKFMSHTTAANLALFYGVRGRIIPTSAAGVSSSLAVGYGYEAVAAGHADVMICGGAEELHVVPVGVFDILRATSTRYNDDPASSPRPFDARRDGLVVGEGAATVILEAEEHARARGAQVFGEVIGFGTNCDGTHLTSPSSEGMAAAMRLALRDAGVDATALDYVNAHATATEVGDIAESHAMAAVLGEEVPVSSTKSQTGHTLGACGALEVAFCLTMMREGFLAPSGNLDEVDPRCAPLHYLRGDPVEATAKVVMTNNFAFGGINTSIILAGAP